MELQSEHSKYLHIALLQLLLLLPAAQSQHYSFHPSHGHHAQRPSLYYDAPARLRRFEYVPAPFVQGYVAPPAAHYQQQTPNFQLINYRPSYQPLAPLEYQQQQPPAPAPAPPLPSLYPLPSVQYQQRAAPQSELAKYRYEGNYIPIQQRVPVAPRRAVVEEQLYNVPPALFTSDVLHVVPSRAAAVQEAQAHAQAQAQAQAQAERPRRFAGNQQLDNAGDGDGDAVAAESRTSTKEEKYFHDIFMRFDGPHGRSSGHVLEHPKAQEQRFETQRGTNRYKGEVIWTDRRGGHGEHRWDMAQGKL